MKLLFKTFLFWYYADGDCLVQSFFDEEGKPYRTMKRKEVKRITGNLRWWNRRSAAGCNLYYPHRWPIRRIDGCLQIGCVGFTKEQTDILRNWANGAS